MGWNGPEFEEADEDQDIEAAGVENLVLGDGEGEADPGGGGEEAADGEAGVEGDGAVLGEAAGIVDGSIGRLLLEDGEEREN